MVNLKKPSANKGLQHQLQAFLADVFFKQKIVNPKLVLAYSGGLDSTVLLHLLTECYKILPFQLTAHHVHHGLSSNADDWADFCQKTCATLNVKITLSTVNINKNSGLGVEATAREARYTALFALDADFICLAHHQDDQAETLLLQLARGAGIKGLAGMAAIDLKRKLLRPLLDVPRPLLEDYAKQNQLNWITDETNVDTAFDRNFMRHMVLPVLQQQYPSITQTIRRAASHMADANDLLDELAQIDALFAGFHAQNTTTISLSALKNLSKTRVNNLIRWWLAQNNLPMPSTQQLLQIAQQLLHAKQDAAIELKVSETLTLRRYQHRAYLVQNMPPNALINQLWQGEKVVDLPNNTRLIFSQKMGEGISLRKIENAKLRIKFREGNERFKLHLGRPSQSLKVILQSVEMPPWQRQQLPLIFMDESLVIIPNIGVDAGLKAAENEMGLVLEWQV